MVFASPRSQLRPFGLWATFAVASCVGLGGGPAEAGKKSTPNLVVRMCNPAVTAADHVFVTIERVDIWRKVASGGERDECGVRVVKETVTSTPGQYDLMDLQHGLEAVLGGGTFPAGDYRSIRLIVDKDSKHDIKRLPADQLNNYIVIDGVAYPLLVPGGEKIGIKLGQNFSITEGETTVLTIAFDVRESIRKVGKKGVYRLKPRLKIVPNVEDVDPTLPLPLSGNVTTMDNSGLPSGTMVSVQQGGVQVASTAPDPMSGAYAFPDLADGTYDIVVIAPGYTFDSERGVVVVGGMAGTHSFEVAPSAAGLVYGTVTSPFGTADASVSLVWNGFVVATVEASPADGFYLFDNVVVGDYLVVATDGTSTVSQTTTVVEASASLVDLGL